MTERAGLHILQNGVPRSGNVWLQHLVREGLEECGVPVRQNIVDDPVAGILKERDLGIAGIAEADFIRIQPNGCFYTVLDVYQWPIEDIDAYARGTTYASSHSAWNSAMPPVYAAFSHIIYIVRDPRDAAISMSRFAFSPFNRLHRPPSCEDPSQYLRQNFESMLLSWAQHVGGHVEHRDEVNLHFVAYERLIASPADEIGRLAACLGLALSPVQIDRIVQRNTFQQLKRVQPHHLATGRWGQWRDMLSRRQIAQAQRITGPLLDYFGYPMDQSEGAVWSAQELLIS